MKECRGEVGGGSPGLKAATLKSQSSKEGRAWSGQLQGGNGKRTLRRGEARWRVGARVVKRLWGQLSSARLNSSLVGQERCAVKLSNCQRAFGCVGDAHRRVVRAWGHRRFGAVPGG